MRVSCTHHLHRPFRGLGCLSTSRLFRAVRLNLKGRGDVLKVNGAIEDTELVISDVT